MDQKKKYKIPKTEYIDPGPEISFVPIDIFVVFIGSFLLSLLKGFSLFAFPISIVATLGWYRFKKNKPKNFYMTIPYALGLKRPKGVPPVTVKEFME